MDTTLRICSTIFQPVALVRNLDVYMDIKLNMRVHIGKVSSATFFHLRSLHQLHLHHKYATDAMSCLGLCPISYWLL